MYYVDETFVQNELSIFIMQLTDRTYLPQAHVMNACQKESCGILSSLPTHVEKLVASSLSATKLLAFQ